MGENKSKFILPTQNLFECSIEQKTHRLQNFIIKLSHVSHSCWMSLVLSNVTCAK